MDAAGNRIRDRETLGRIAALVLPPAWTEVWICPWPNGHLQAIGTDAAVGGSTATTTNGVGSATG